MRLSSGMPFTKADSTAHEPKVSSTTRGPSNRPRLAEPLAAPLEDRGQLIVDPLRQVTRTTLPVLRA